MANLVIAKSNGLYATSKGILQDRYPPLVKVATLEGGTNEASTVRVGIIPPACCKPLHKGIAVLHSGFCFKTHKKGVLRA